MGQNIDVIASYGFYVNEKNLDDIQVFFDIETENWEGYKECREIGEIGNDLYKIERAGSAYSGEYWYYIVLRNISLEGLTGRITEFKNILDYKKLDYKIELIKDFWES